MATSEQPDMGKWALAYARRGLYVFPCHWPVNGGCSCGHADCDSLAKHPKTLRGLLDATTDEDTINRWWKRWPEANIGVAVGMSGRLVIDVDPRNGGNEAFAALLAREGIELETFTVQTGGGGFRYYLAPADLGEINKSIAHGVDCKGIGGYVLGAGSLHMSGARYEVASSKGQGPVELPDALRKLVEKPVREPRPAAGPRTYAGDSVGTRYGRRALEEEVAAVRGAPEGQRNETLNRAASRSANSRPVASSRLA